VNPDNYTVYTADEVRALAIEYQQWASKEFLSYNEVADWQELFMELGKKFNLTDEFKENGII
jgi:hypothetical protein